MATVHDKENMKYKGLIDHHTGQILAAISRNFTVTFTPFLDYKQYMQRNAISQDHRSLLVIVYGFQRDGDEIGNYFSDSGLHLQHPANFEHSVPYKNPQYLLRPDSDLRLPISEISHFKPRKIPVDQVLRPQLSQVFDTATGPDIFSNVQLSCRLVTELKSWVPQVSYGGKLKNLMFNRYQRKAVAMMAEKESGKLENQEFPSLWVLRSAMDGRIRRVKCLRYSLVEVTS